MKRAGGWVYFAKPVGADGPIKIGVTQNPDQRLSLMQTSSPVEIEFAAVLWDDEPGVLEQRFHALFKQFHQRREWFEGSSDIHAVVTAINDGTFSKASLPEPLRGLSQTVGGVPTARKAYEGSVTGVPGVRPAGRRSFSAQFTINRVTYRLGTFPSLEDAVAARREAERKHGIPAPS